MLSGLSKAARIRSALVLVAMYALCNLAPNAAIALNSAPCLPEQPATAQIHVHESYSGHDHNGTGDGHHHDVPGHHDDDGDGSHTGTKCCGTTFFSAIAPALEASLAPNALRATSFEGRIQAFTGLAPGKLIRPPKPLS